MSVIKCEWSKQLNGKAESVRLHNKTRFNYMLSTRNTTLHPRIKVKLWGKKDIP